MTDILRHLNGLTRPVDGLLTAQEWQERAVQTEVKLLRVAARASALQDENEQLRRNYRRQRPTYRQIAYRAMADCELMYGLFLAGYTTTRERCLQDLGISKRRWAWARALGQLSGVHDGTEFYSHLALREVIQRLHEGVSAAQQQPDLLRLYMPRNGGTPGR